MSQYYTYVIRSRGDVMYVGKGTGSRWKAHMARSELTKLGSLEISVDFCESESAALHQERLLILLYENPRLLNKVGRVDRGWSTQEVREFVHNSFSDINWMDEVSAALMLDIPLLALRRKRRALKGPPFHRVSHNMVRYNKKELLAWINSQDSRAMSPCAT